MKRLVMYCAIAALLLSFAAVQTPETARLSAATASATAKIRVAKVHVTVPTLAATMAGTMTPGSITAKITAWILPLRDGPSRRGKILDKLKHNTIVTVIGVNRFHTWIKVLLNDGQPVGGASGQSATMQPTSGQVGWISVFYVQLFGGRLKSVPVVG